MTKIIYAAIAAVFLFSGAAWAGCPVSMNGKDVSLTGTVAKLKSNPHVTSWTGDWSLRVNAPNGPCAGLVVIRTAERPSCAPGQEVSVSGKVVRDAWFGNNTSVLPEGELSCQPIPVRRTAVAKSPERTIDAAR
ncbi:MAG: hypothetical protein ACREQI_07255 [Candidatus Binataceae bacterium]